MRKICENCTWVDKFNPRKDEIDKGHLLGCKYPGWVGYVHSDDAKKCSTFYPLEDKHGTQ